MSERTVNVLLESANFEPVSILRSSERLGLRTEGSNRWEKGVDPYLAGHAARLASSFSSRRAAHAGWGRPTRTATLPERQRIELRPARTSELLGLEIAADEQRDILRRLGFDLDGDTVTVPTWRARDVTREADLSRKSRASASTDVPVHAARAARGVGRLTREQRLRRTVEDLLVGLRPVRGLYAEPRGGGPRSGCAPPAAAALRRAVGAAHDPVTKPALGGRAQPRGWERRRRPVRDRARLSAQRRAAADRALACRGRARGRISRRKGRRRHGARRVEGSDRSRARHASVAASREDGRIPQGWIGEVHPGARRPVGPRSNSTSTRLQRLCRSDCSYRGRHHVPVRAPGPRVHRRRRCAGGGARRCDPRGRRARGS